MLKLSKIDWGLGWLLIGIWILHGIGVVMPETAFDAVWYHLPVARAVAEAGRLVYLPELYQSVNPLVGEILFAVGWKIAGELGVKVVAFGVALVTLYLCWRLARMWLPVTWSLVALVLVSLIQVVTWQASSAYVDVLKAGWELFALWCLSKYWPQPQAKWWWFASLGVGLSLGTKLFSVLLLPLWWAWARWLRVTPQMVAGSMVVIGAIALPFYWWAHSNTGLWWPSLSAHGRIISEIGVGENMWAHAFTRATRMWQSPWFFLIGRDYVNWICLLCLPWLLTRVPQWWRDVPTRLALSLIGYQWLVWWFIPPLSTRYALSGFIVLVILTVRVLHELSLRSRMWQVAVVLTLALSMSFHLAPRLLVLKRQLPYLFGTQTETEYLTQFLDGNIDTVLKQWHQF